MPLLSGIEGPRFEVNVIPHTRERTTFRSLECGARVNLEADMMARYAERLLGSVEVAK